VAHPVDGRREIAYFKYDRMQRKKTNFVYLYVVNIEKNTGHSQWSVVKMRTSRSVNSRKSDIR